MADPSVWAVVPLKPLSAAKQRLSGLLNAEERRQLTLAMLRDVLSALTGASSLTGVLLVSREPEASAIAEMYRIDCLDSADDKDLNSALETAADAVAARGGQAMMIVPGDLPLLRVEDVETTLAAARSTVTLIAAADGDGTNCLLLNPPTAITPAFGPGSFDHHRKTAVGLELDPLVLHSEAFALDIDTVDDIAVFRSAGTDGETARYLATLDHLF